MKSTVTKLFDRSLVVVPDELRKWHIDDSEVEEQLVTLARTHGTEIKADEVQKGDSVRLSCNDGKLKERVILIFPGLNLPGAAEAESAVLGCRAGDQVTAAINGNSLNMTVKEILRKIPAEIDDELAKKENLDGVNTLDDYRRAYRKKKEEQNRSQAKKMLSNFILDEITERSEYALDREEIEAWKEENARAEYNALIQDGEGPKITEDGKVLTEEEAINQIKEEVEHYFKRELICDALCADMGISLEWKDLKPEFEQMIPPELAAIMSEEEMKEAKESFMKNAAVTKVYDLLYKEADAYLED